jgi:ATP synthase protein I
MSNDTRGNPRNGLQPPDEAALSARLRHLGERLDRNRPEPLPDARSEARSQAEASGFARGFRLSSELVGGVVVGAGLGWVLDRWLGISPWGLIVFVLLGFVAGVFNVVRSARMSPPGGAGEA